MDFSSIYNFIHASEEGLRAENNRGRTVNSKGWITHEQAARNASKAAIGIFILFGLLKGLLWIGKRCYLKWGMKGVAIYCSIFVIAGWYVCHLKQQREDEAIVRMICAGNPDFRVSDEQFDVCRQVIADLAERDVTLRNRSDLLQKLGSLDGEALGRVAEAIHRAIVMLKDESDVGRYNQMSVMIQRKVDAFGEERMEVDEFVAALSTPENILKELEYREAHYKQKALAAEKIKERIEIFYPAATSYVCSVASEVVEKLREIGDGKENVQSVQGELRRFLYDAKSEYERSTIVVNAYSYNNLTNRICQRGRSAIENMQKYISESSLLRVQVRHYIDKMIEKLDAVDKTDPSRRGSYFVRQFEDKMYSYRYGYKNNPYTSELYEKAKVEIDNVYQEYLNKVREAIGK